MIRPISPLWLWLTLGWITLGTVVGSVYALRLVFE